MKRKAFKGNFSFKAPKTLDVYTADGILSHMQSIFSKRNWKVCELLQGIATWGSWALIYFIREMHHCSEWILFLLYTKVKPPRTMIMRQLYVDVMWLYLLPRRKNVVTPDFWGKKNQTNVGLDGLNIAAGIFPISFLLTFWLNEDTTLKC